MRDYCPVRCLAQTTVPVEYAVDDYSPGHCQRRYVVDHEPVRCSRDQGHAGPHRATLDGVEKEWSE